MSQSQESWLIGKTQTQALYGQEVQILRTYGRWAEVAVKSQDTPKHRAGYPGWVPMRQLTESNNAQLRSGRLMVQFENKHGLIYRDRGLDRVDHSVSYGTRLPVTGGLQHFEGRIRVADPEGGHSWVRSGHVRLYREDRVRDRAKPSPVKIRREALKFRGTPYIWGGTSSYGLDCSGLTYQLYRHFGIEIPRDAGDQRRAGDPVGWRNKKPGDLIFFGPSARNITHTGMYIGNGKMVHAAYGNRIVRVQSFSESGKMDEYQGVRRMH